MTLLPDWIDEDIMMTDDEEETVQEGRSYEYDYGARAVVTTTSGRTIKSDLKDAYLWWVYKCLHTERYQYKYYSTDFGVEVLSIIGSDYPRVITESEIKRTIDEALSVDNRTISTSDYHFAWTTDTLTVDFVLESVYGTDNVTMRRGDI